MANFKPFYWWSDWEDIGPFDFGGNGYILQASRSRTNKVRFRCAPMKAFMGIAHPSSTTYRQYLADKEDTAMFLND